MVTRKLAWSLVVIALLFFLSAFMFQGTGQDRVTGVRAHEAWPEGCTLATLHGTYGAWEQGMFTGQVGPNPPGTQVAIVAIGTLDGAGNISGTWRGSFSGSVVPPTPFIGTYTVNPDCTYSDEFSPGGPGFVLHHWGVISDHGNEIHYIYSDTGTVVSGTLKKSW